MTKSISIIKGTAIVLLNIIAGILIAISYLISVYKYEWTQDPEMSKIINTDAVLVGIVMLATSAICASIAFVLKRKLKIQLITFIVMLILIIYKLIQIIPLYAG